MPTVVLERADGTREMHPLAIDPVEAVEHGRRMLAQSPRAVLVFDGYIGSQDAILVEGAEQAQGRFMVAIPYRPSGFALFPPRVLGIEGMSLAPESLLEGFLTGVKQHTQGASVWLRSYQSGQLP